MKIYKNQVNGMQ